MTTDAKFTFTTIALSRELPSDHHELSPAIAPGTVAYGSLDRALTELTLALSELPDEARPTTVARYLLPAGVRLETIAVALPVPDRPGRLGRKHPIELTIVVVPEPRRDTPVPAGHWVFIPALAHACFVDRKEDLATRVAAEIALLPEAHQLDLDGWRRLLTYAPAALEPITVELATTPLSAAQGKKAMAAAERMRIATATLDGAGTRIDPPPAAERTPLVGRAALLDDLTRALDDRARRSVLLVGEEAVGKSALVHAWAAQGTAAPDRTASTGQRRPMWATSVGELVAGASGLGQWQARVAAVLAAAEELDAVLYFDDFGALFADRPAEGGVEIGAAMRRHVVDGRVRVVGELAPATLDRAERRDVSLIGAMQRIHVPPTDVATTIAAARAHAERWAIAQPHRPQLAPETIAPAVELARRFLPYRAFPGKAIRLLEELRASHDRGRDARGAGPVLGERDLYAAFAWATGIPIALLSDADALAPETVVAHLRRRMIGQEPAVRRVAEAICVAKARLAPADKPLASLLFVGPTGTGKTELARSVAAYLFGAPDRMVRLDMSEYTDPYAAERLFGSGTDDGRLTSAVRSQPFGVVLLDEIEKAHPSVFDLLLQVLGEARLTDGRGRTTYFHNAIVILTSNLGTRGAKGTLGLRGGADAQRTDRERAETRFRDAVLGAFRPELINRLDQIVVFHPLEPAEIARVADIAVARLAERRGLTQTGVALDVSPRALEVIAERGFSAELGARALRRYVDASLLAPAGRLLAKHGEAGHGGTLTVRADDEAAPRSSGGKLGDLAADGLSVALWRRSAQTGRRMIRSALALGGLRRASDRELAHASAVAVRDRIADLEATLATATRKQKRKKDAGLPGAEIARLSTEHARLAARRDACATGQADLRTAEELCLEALAQDVDAIDLIDGAIATRQQFRRDLFWLYVALQPTSPGATIMVSAPGHRGGLVEYCATVIAAAELRDWTATVHVWGEAAPGGGAAHSWGPPHDAAWVREKLAATAGAALVCITGRGATQLVGLDGAPDGGLHRFEGITGATGPCHVWVDLLEKRSDFTRAEWAALPLPGAPKVPRGEPLRSCNVTEDEVTVGGEDLDIAWRDLAVRYEEVAVTALTAAIAAEATEQLWKWDEPVARNLAALAAPKGKV